MRGARDGSITVALIIILCLFSCNSFAQEDSGIKQIKKSIEAPMCVDAPGAFQQLSQAYFKNNQYDEFADYLKNLRQTKPLLDSYIAYYLAKTRFEQLNYLVGAQDWNEYFNKGDDYRSELENELDYALSLL